jgi:hypothetical protein
VYVATYAGDTVTAISTGGDAVLGHYLLPEPKEFGTLIYGTALAGSTLFLPRTLVNKLALLDSQTGATRTQLSANDLGVASINGVIAGSTGHVFVFASGPLPKTAPVIAESLILELDERGAVVRRASIPTGSGNPGYGTSSGAVYDRASDTLFFGLLAATGDGGAIAELGPLDRSVRELFTTPGQPLFLGLDTERRVLCVGTAISVGGADRTQVELRALSTNATIRTRALDRGTGLVAAVLDDVGSLLFVTGPLRDREADQVLALDATSLEVLASAEIPWDPYGHGIAVDARRQHIFVSSRVRPASVTTIAFATHP